MVTQAAEQYSLDQLAEEFVRRYREGERPSIAEYVAQYPQLAEEIEQLFPMLAVFEQAGPGSSSLLGACPEVVQAATSVPSQLGDYRILRCIGRGGMGVVYEAIQEPLGRHVALKVLSGNHLANPVLLERFRIEARAAASLHHTNIVPVFDVGEEDGTHYYAMQYIQGQSLYAVILELRRLEKTPLARHLPDDEEADNTARTIAQGLISGQVAAPQPIAYATTEPGPPSVSLFEVPTVPDVQATPPVSTDSVTSSDLNTQSRGQYFRRVASIGIQVAEALAYAHERGIVHRDVKPSNLLLDVQGRVWVTDFGLAKAEGSGELTRTGDFVGTLRYMAPERFKGKSDAVSDVYSLGVTLYELATRQPAFAGTNEAQLLLNIAKEDPPRPRQRDGRVPRDLETIIVKAMDKSPARRYASALDLAADLRRFTEDKPIRARRTTRPERLWRWSRRNPALASLVALVTFVAVVGLPGVTWLWQNAEASRDAERTANVNLESALTKSESSRKAELAAKETLETTDYFQKIALAERKMAAFEILTALALLDECPREMREWEWHYLRQAWLSYPILLPSVPEKPPHLAFMYAIANSIRIAFGGILKMGAYSVAFHPTQEQFVTGNGDGTINCRDSKTGAVISTFPAHSSLVFSVAISPDGRYLLSAGEDKRVRLWDWQTKRLLDDHPGHSGWEYGVANAVAFHPERGEYASGDENGDLIVREVPTGRELFRIPGDKSAVSSIAFSRDGRWLATGSWGGSVKIWDAQTGTQRANLEWDCPDPASSVMFDPDGKWLYAACFDHKIWACPLDGGEARLLSGHADIVTAAAFSPNGRRFASAGGDLSVRLWDPQTKREALTLQTAEMARALAFSPDGLRLVAVGPRSVQIWEADPNAQLRGEERHNLTGHDRDVWRAVFSPDGRQIASCGGDRTVRLWNALSGKEEHVDRRHPLIVFCVDYSRDGRIASLSVQKPSVVDADLRIWDPKSTTREDERVIQRGKNYFVAKFTPDGRYVIAAGTGRVIDIWDAQSDATEPFKKLAGHRAEISNIAISKDGSRMASATNETIIIWDLRTFRSVRTTEAANSPSVGSGVALSPDGRLLAYCGVGGVVAMLDIDTGEVREFAGHNAHVFSVAFSPDGRILATGSHDCTIKLWEVSTGKELKELKTLRGHTGPVSSLDFNYDGTQLVSASRWDHTVKVWDVAP